MDQFSAKTYPHLKTFSEGVSQATKMTTALHQKAYPSRGPTGLASHLLIIMNQ
jgi:hypothetical protein